MVLLGVMPRADRPAGVDDSANAIDRVLEAALSIDPPLIIPLPQIVRVRGTVMVVVQVPRGMPYVYALGGRYLARRGNANHPLPPDELRRLLLERGDVTFEAEPTRNATRDDLDWGQVETYATNLGGMGGTTPSKCCSCGAW